VIEISPTRGSLWLISPSAAWRVGVPKIRPWLILQDNAFAAYDGRIACYLTSVFDGKGRKRKMRDGQVRYTLRERASYICGDSLYTIRKTEFLRHVGDIDEITMAKVSIAVNLILGVDHISI
jgi:mRNA-degrading endonuclease toxin of MazEF toxin-antitoxin module